MEVMQMEKCTLCGKETGEFGEIHCGRCDKFVGDAQAELAAEFGAEDNAGLT